MTLAIINLNGKGEILDWSEVEEEKYQPIKDGRTYCRGMGCDVPVDRACFGCHYNGQPMHLAAVIYNAPGNRPLNEKRGVACEWGESPDTRFALKNKETYYPMPQSQSLPQEMQGRQKSRVALL